MLTISEIVKRKRQIKEEGIKNRILNCFYTKILDNALDDIDSGEISIIFDERKETDMAAKVIQSMLNPDSLEFDFKNYVVSPDYSYTDDYEIFLNYDLNKEQRS